MTFFLNTWQVLVELAPWLFLGAAVAGVLRVFLPGDFISRHLGKNSFGNVLKAVFFGVPMPLCSCGVIPAAIGIKKGGASDGASVGFLISTPQTGIDSIFVSASFLGWPFAVFKVISAFITGLLGGVAVNLSTPDVQPGAATMKPDKNGPRSRKPGLMVKEFYEFIILDLIYGIWKWIVIGILVSAAITTFVPENTLADSPFTAGITGKVVVLIFSLGLYVCATSSVPIAASLVAAGMPMGSALVFLMAGPATNFATIGTVFKTFGRRVLVLYLLVISIGSICLGLFFDSAFKDASSTLVVDHHGQHWLGIILGAAFAALLLWYAFKDLKRAFFQKSEASKHTMEQIIRVQGMTCATCALKVERALKASENVNTASVDFKKGIATVHGQGLRLKVLIAAVEKAGYKVLP